MDIERPAASSLAPLILRPLERRSKLLDSELELEVSIRCERNDEVFVLIMRPIT
jgi:hypothetical protein